MIQVAGYCRVSTDKADQANSFQSQQRYFRDYIARHPDWELYEIYADEGVTGTSTKKRTQFNRMIRDARDGKFSLIITKEVSRFSRNILDTISHTRALRSMGVGVVFATDGIHTMEPDAELRLSIFASIAQEESRRTSARVVWGQTRQMERGVVFGRSLLGYTVKNGQITVNPHEAQLVRLIFLKYAREQMSPSRIAKFLTTEGYLTHRGKETWNANAIIRILRNEKYVGDLVQKKTYTPDYLTHEKKRNTGQVPFVRLENHHTPIISRELWEQAQNRLRQQNRHLPGSLGHSSSHPFSGKILCGECGAAFVARYQYMKSGEKILRWSCAAAAGAGACNIGKLVRDEDAMTMLRVSLASLQVDVLSHARSAAALAMDAMEPENRKTPEEDKQLAAELNRVQQKRERMLDSYFSREISKEEMLSWKEKYDIQIRALLHRLEKEEKNLEIPGIADKIFQEAAAIARGERESDIFCKTIVHSLRVFKDRHMELRLNQLPQVFHFSG